MSKLNFKTIFKGDVILAVLIVALMLISVLVISSSAGSPLNFQNGRIMNNSLKHIILLAVGFVIMWGTQAIHYRYYYVFAKPIFWIALFLLLVTRGFSGGDSVGEGEPSAKRWLDIGVSIQVSDLAKIGLILVVAQVINSYQEEKHCNDKALKKIALYALPIVVLVFIDNTSTALLIGFTCFCMLFAGRVRFSLLLKVAGGALAVLILFILLSTSGIGEVLNKKTRSGTIVSRIETFFQPVNDLSGKHYQPGLAKIAVANGNIRGLGIGKSKLRNILPNATSDYVFAIIVEEYGLLGGTFILLLYSAILLRIIRIVGRCTRVFPAMVVTGLGTIIVFQAFINIAVGVGLFPVTGQQLPLISTGGTSIFVTCAALGMILSISRTFTKAGEVEEEEQPQAETRRVETVVD